MNRLTLVRKNLFRKKTRSTLLLLSIAIAFLLYGALGAFNQFWEDPPQTPTRLVTLNKINFTQPLPYAYYNRIQSVDGIAAASHANWFGGYFREPTNVVTTFAVEPEGWFTVYPEFDMPADQRTRFISDRTCMAAGAPIAEQYGWSVGDRIPLQSNIFTRADGAEAWQLEVCAIYTSTADTAGAGAVLLHYELFRETASFGGNSLGWFVLLTEDAALNESVSRSIDDMFANSSAETETSTEAAFNQAFLEQFGDIATILSLVIGAAFVSILIIVGTTMVLSIAERTKEIGVLKTLGFRNNAVFGLVLAESIFLSLLGGLIGLGLAAGLLAGAEAGLGDAFPPIVMTVEIVGSAVALMLLFGLITGVIPAASALRLKIIDAFSKG